MTNASRFIKLLKQIKKPNIRFRYSGNVLQEKTVYHFSWSLLLMDEMSSFAKFWFNNKRAKLMRATPFFILFQRRRCLECNHDPCWHHLCLRRVRMSSNAEKKSFQSVWVQWIKKYCIIFQIKKLGTEKAYRQMEFVIFIMQHMTHR